jgi:adenylosuccinate synthase
MGRKKGKIVDVLTLNMIIVFKGPNAGHFRI